MLRLCNGHRIMDEMNVIDLPISVLMEEIVIAGMTS